MNVAAIGPSIKIPSRTKIASKSIVDRQGGGKPNYQEAGARFNFVNVADISGLILRRLLRCLLCRIDCQNLAIACKTAMHSISLRRPRFNMTIQHLPSWLHASSLRFEQQRLRQTTRQPLPKRIHPRLYL